MKKTGLSSSDIALILANLVPLVGVIFLDWEPLAVFVIYILESVIAGIFNVIKMLTVYVSNREVALRKQPGDSGISGFALIPFFMFHYFFFVFVQCILFFAYSGIGKDTFGPLRLIENFKPYVYGESGWAVGGIALSYAVSYSMDFMLNGEFRNTSISQLFFRPYKRIFVQQFVVLLGGWIFILFSSFLPKTGLVIFVALFTAIKIWFDLYFEKKVREAGADMRFE